MLESEINEHLGYQNYESPDNPDFHNGKKTKKIRSNFGETEIDVPQDRDGTGVPFNHRHSVRSSVLAID